VPCWSSCFVGGVVAHGRQLQAAVLLFQAAEREILALPFSSVFFPLLRLRFLLFLFLFMCVFFSTLVPLLVLVSSFSLSSYSPSPLSLTVPFPCFQLPRFISFFFFRSLSLSFFSFSSLHSLFSLSLAPCVMALGGIYRAKGARASLLLRMGSRALLPCHGIGWAGQWAWLAGRGSPGLSS